MKKAKSSYYEDYKRGVESVGGFVPPPTQDVLRNVKSAADKLKESGRVTYKQVHEFFRLVGVHADYLQCSWKHLTSAKGYAGHGMPVGEDVLSYVVGSKVHGKNRLWVALDAIGHHLTKDEPILDAKASQPNKKPITMSSATSHKTPKKSALHTTPATPPMADALASAPAVPPANSTVCIGLGAEPQALVALDMGVVPTQLMFDLINPNLPKCSLKEEAAAVYYLDYERVDEPIETTL